MAATSAMTQKQYWPPMYESFAAASKDGKPAIKLNLVHPDANITGDDDNPDFVVKTREELEHDVSRLRFDIENQFSGDLDPANDPDVALMQRALDSLDQG